MTYINHKQPETDLDNNEQYGVNGVIGRYKKYNHLYSEIAMACRGDSCGRINRTMPKSWITGNSMVIKFKPEY